jgi:single-strand DNA-binding protein
LLYAFVLYAFKKGACSMTDSQTQTASLNSVTLVGRAGKDPEIKYFDSGSVKASFSLAVDRPGSKENRTTDWFNIEAWGRLAEVMGEYLKKGTQIAVTGRAAERRYNDAAGNERVWLSINATDIKLLGSRRDNEGGGGGGYASMPSSNAAPF